jgi:hypothetical protein
MLHTLVLLGNSYTDHLGFAPLHGVRADVSAIENLFRTWFPKYEVFKLVDESEGRIVAAVNETVAKTPPGGDIVVYFAGHAIARGNGYALACHDAAVEDFKSSRGWLAVDRLEQMTDAVSGRRLFLFDTCRTSSFIRGSRGLPPVPQEGEGSARNFGPRDTPAVASRDITGVVTPTPSLTVLWGAEEGELALEMPDGAGGIFTQSLVRLLERDAREGRRIAFDAELLGRLSQEMSEAQRQDYLAAPRPCLSGNLQDPFVLRSCTGE